MNGIAVQVVRHLLSDDVERLRFPPRRAGAGGRARIGSGGDTALVAVMRFVKPPQDVACVLGAARDAATSASSRLRSEMSCAITANCPGAGR